MAKSAQRIRITPRSEAIVDWEILNPGVDANICAERLGINISTLSIIKNSDAFIDYRARRLASHHESISGASIVEKTEELAKLSIDIMSERFNAKRSDIPLDTVRDTCEMALKALGFGNRPAVGQPASGNVNVFVGASPEQLASAREKMIRQNSENAVVIEQVSSPSPVEVGGPEFDPSDKLLQPT
jgi:hypothetical protein